MILKFGDNIDLYNRLFKSKRGENKMIEIVNQSEILPSEIYWSKVEEDGIIPQKRIEDAGWDLYASFAAKGDDPFYLVYPFETYKIPTGIATAFSPEYYMKIEERSSTGSRGIKVSSGIIDSGYRGEITIMLYNASDKYLVITKDSNMFVRIRENLSRHLGGPFDYDKFEFVDGNKAIAQAIVMPLAPITNSHELPYNELYERFASERGTGKLGSTGK